MADEEITNAEVSAEKAYAAAAEAVPVKAEAETEPAADPVEFPAKAKRAPKVAAAKAPAVKAAVSKVEAPVIEAPAASGPAAKAPALPKPRRASIAKPAKPRITAAPIVKKARPAVAKPASKPAALKTGSALPAKAKLPIKPLIPVPPAAKIKDKTMETTAEFTEGLQKVAADTQVKAKKAFEKGTALFGEYAEFAKGNVEAVVESGKILATGMQKLGTEIVAEGKTAFETATADAKQFAAIKSPTEFFKLQSDIVRRNIDSAVKLSSKNGETMMKLATDSFAPISGRFSLAMGKFKKAA